MCSRHAGRSGHHRRFEHGFRVTAATVLAFSLLKTTMIGSVAGRSFQWPRPTEREYSGWVGESCATETRLSDFWCHEHTECKEQCAAACNRHPSCDAFMIDAGEQCNLYSGCNFIWNDGCDDCDVYVCLDNCPSGTPPWYGSHGYWRCRGGYLSKVDMGTSCIGMGCIDECGSMCNADPACTNFMLDDDSSECMLFDGCDTDYDDDEWFTGSIRDRASEQAHIPNPSGCFKMYTGWSYKPDGGSKFYAKHDNLEECFAECSGDSIVVVGQDSGKCYCWRPNEGQWVKTGGDTSFSGYSNCYWPTDIPRSFSWGDRGCKIEVYEGYSYKPWQDGKWESKRVDLLSCLEDSDDGAVIDNGGSGSSCYVWEEHNGQLQDAGRSSVVTYWKDCTD